MNSRHRLNLRIRRMRTAAIQRVRQQRVHHAAIDADLVVDLCVGERVDVHDGGAHAIADQCVSEGLGLVTSLLRPRVTTSTLAGNGPSPTCPIGDACAHTSGSVPKAGW